MKSKYVIVSGGLIAALTIGMLAAYGQPPAPSIHAVAQPSADARPPVADLNITSPHPHFALLYGIAHNHEIAELEHESRTLAEELRSLPADQSDQREAYRSKLLAILDKAFEARQELHAKQAAELKERLAKVEDTIQQRNQNKKLIVENRLSELLGEGGVLSWETSAFVPPPASGATSLWKVDVPRRSYLTRQPPARAETDIHVAKSEFDAAQADFARAQEMRKQSVITEREFREAELEVKRWKAALKSELDNLELRDRLMTQRADSLKRRLETTSKKIKILQEKREKNPDDDKARIEVLEAEQELAEIGGQLENLSIEREQLTKAMKEIESQEDRDSPDRQ